ncbi:MAG TPA: biotin--[acetyl-CoA-carboxylase] ligase [Gemmataceae bacterium]|nr:biotin--[acetyl-CoA-carboxylase] ligase [Gemmataceae bacterium]
MQERNDPGRKHIGRRIGHYASIESTNALAAALPCDPAHHGLVIIADEQTAGRGQYGRHWVAPPGSSVLMSIVLYPLPELLRPALLCAWAAVSVAEVVFGATGRQSRIKWPNDVLLKGRKIAGILVEQARSTVLGIGLNVTQSAENFERAGLPQAGSLASVTGQSLKTSEIARALIERLDAEYDDLLHGETPALESRWKWHFGLLGHEVIAVDAGGDTHRGRLRDMTFDRIELEQPCGVNRLRPEVVRQLLPAQMAAEELGANNS